MGKPEMNVSLQRFRLRRLASVFTILATLTAGIVIGSVVAHGVHGQDKTVDTRDATPLQVPAAKDLATNFTKIAKEVGPAVVNINTTQLPKDQRATRGKTARPVAPDQGQGDGDDDNDDDQGQGGGGQGGDNGMQDFFNRFFGGGGGMGNPNPQMQEQRALGSGFIVDPRGYIVTNNHVVDKADRIYVKLSTMDENSQGVPATVVGVDKETDLAVIKINVGHPLPTVKLGNSDGAQVGDSVEAIGSPFSLSQTVTAGIISAKNRSIELGPAGQFKRYIQTDAAINPGNSGGPLLDMDGDVIGVNTAIFTESNGYQGIGFAMPSNIVIDVYNHLIGPEHRVIRGSIGIQFQSYLSDAIQKMYDAQTGVLISNIVPGMPADKAGLKVNDVIKTIDGKPIKNGDALVDNISPRKPGTTVTVGYVRNGQTMTATVTIIDRNDSMKGGSAGNDDSGNGIPNGPSASQAKLGMTVGPLPEGAPSSLHGVIIKSVKPGSFADEITPQPLQPGLIIEEVNRKPIHSLADYEAAVAPLKSGDAVVFLITTPRGGAGNSTLVGGTLQ